MTACPTPSLALLLTPDGGLSEVGLPSTSRERLALMYSLMRCSYVDVVHLTTGLDIWVDDEGIFNHPVNPVATALARRFGYVWQPYHGPVLLTGGTDGEGQTLPLDQSKARALLTALEDIVS